LFTSSWCHRGRTSATTADIAVLFLRFPQRSFVFIDIHASFVKICSPDPVCVGSAFPECQLRRREVGASPGHNFVSALEWSGLQCLHANLHVVASGLQRAVALQHSVPGGNLPASELKLTILAYVAWFVKRQKVREVKGVHASSPVSAIVQIEIAREKEN